MLVLGQGGTGKSTLIKAITETFRFYGKEDILAKCATTGIAATDIGAATLHSWAGLNHNIPKTDDWKTKASSANKAKRQKNISGKEFLILDEVSMEDKETEACVSEIVGEIRGMDGKGKPQEPFGSMHVIKFGDFHQFPPVGNPTGALYVDRPDKDSQRAILGREIFLQFDKVVILEKQNRVTDITWNNILNRLRTGDCTKEDIEEVQKLDLTNPECIGSDISKAPWDDAILVTPRHSVRNLWNEHAIIKHCVRSGSRRYLVPAEDESRDGTEALPMEARLAIAGMQDKQTGKLPRTLPLAIGMKAMVLLNLATEADIANGTRGIIQDIVFDPREGPHQEDEDGIHKLQYPPAMILFKPDKGTNIKFEGLPDGVIPLTPSRATFKTTGRSGKVYKIRRKQYAMTAGYAFTDYKSQGQTIEYVIIDISTPPTGQVTPFSVYVALSRSRGRDTIRILRDFDVELFQRHPSEELRKDMRRLESLNEKTREEWEKRKRSDDSGHV